VNDLHGIIFAYRSDSHLSELTRHRNTCSLPFGGRYRLIDFMLSGFVNAGIRDVGVIVHESYQSLLDHLASGKDWDLSRKHGGLRILPPFSYAERRGSGGYRGSMEALSGVFSYLQNIRQDYVILAWGDMAVNFPVEEMFQQHLDSGADITMVCTSTDADTTCPANMVTLDSSGRIADLSIHPSMTTGHLKSAEVYLLSKQLLLDMVDYCSAHNLYGFVSGVLQPRIHSLKIMPYLHKGYTARFRSVSEYFQCSMQLLSLDVRTDLFNQARPIRTKDMSTPSTYYGSESKAVNSLISDGCFIDGEVENCILSRGVVVEAGARVADSILMQGTIVRRNVSMSYVVADKNVQINSSRMLMGHSSYPLAIAKNSIV